MNKLGSGDTQFLGCDLGPAKVISLCFHKPTHTPDRDGILAYLHEQGVDLANDFSLIFDAHGKQDVMLLFGNHESFDSFIAVAQTLRGFVPVVAEPTLQDAAETICNLLDSPTTPPFADDPEPRTVADAMLMDADRAARSVSPTTAKCVLCGHDKTAQNGFCVVRDAQSTDGWCKCRCAFPSSEGETETTSGE